jgi:hypothetical protein
VVFEVVERHSVSLSFRDEATTNNLTCNKPILVNGQLEAQERDPESDLPEVYIQMP